MQVCPALPALWEVEDQKRISLGNLATNQEPVSQFLKRGWGCSSAQGLCVQTPVPKGDRNLPLDHSDYVCIACHWHDATGSLWFILGKVCSWKPGCGDLGLRKEGPIANGRGTTGHERGVHAPPCTWEGEDAEPCGSYLRDLWEG